MVLNPPWIQSFAGLSASEGLEWTYLYKLSCQFHLLGLCVLVKLVFVEHKAKQGKVCTAPSKHGDLQTFYVKQSAKRFTCPATALDKMHKHNEKIKINNCWTKWNKTHKRLAQMYESK